jgi:hypothetical protein
MNNNVKFDPEDIATQIAKVRRIDDIALIASITTDIRNKNESENVKRLATDVKMTPLLQALLACGDYEGEWFSELKNKFLCTVLEIRGLSDRKFTVDELKKMDLLLKYGANPQEKIGYRNEHTCIAYASWNADAVSVFLKNGIDPNSLFDDNTTLLMNAVNEYSQAQWDGHIQSAKARVNVLLYFGADIHMKVKGRDALDCAHYGYWSRLAPEFLKEAQARRVHRLACYLTRCTELPKDVTTEIAQWRYGRLSDEDRKLIAKYFFYDYNRSSR